jgi:cell division protein ZapE
LWFFQKKPSLAHIYLHGPAGRGKTTVMDFFYTHSPIQKKQRMHFYEFMHHTHQALRQIRTHHTDPLVVLAKEWRKTTDILCLDEFDVTDIVDAMILARLLSTFMAQGLSLIFTSNKAPEDLYQNGLQRDRFLPFLHMLHQKFTRISFVQDQDYRQSKPILTQKIYAYPDDAAKKQVFQNQFATLTQTNFQPGHPGFLLKHGRFIPILAQVQAHYYGLCADIFESALGPQDYQNWIEQADSIWIEGIYVFTEEKILAAHRFRQFIDIAYDCGKKIYMLSQCPINELDQTHHALLTRTLSRLYQMSAQD